MNTLTRVTFVGGVEPQRSAAIPVPLPGCTAVRPIRRSNATAVFQGDVQGGAEAVALTTHAEPSGVSRHTSYRRSCCRGITEAPPRRNLDEQTSYTARQTCVERRSRQL